MHFLKKNKPSVAGGSSSHANKTSYDFSKKICFAIKRAQTCPVLCIHTSLTLYCCWCKYILNSIDERAKIKSSYQYATHWIENCNHKFRSLFINFVSKLELVGSIELLNIGLSRQFTTWRSFVFMIRLGRYSSFSKGMWDGIDDLPSRLVVAITYCLFLKNSRNEYQTLKESLYLMIIISKVVDSISEIQ